ncbi:hypothetical protein H4R34_000294 [Dimargaris verticillata]|uniref:Uncharacterized protein n=1 Tax=Dimargaris verticillata TaxID=2761393 RepID=A0A9W8BC36_9FUNG|nr:hypothetical protein H4R34_000294 [Dimargaris verticillata]
MPQTTYAWLRRHNLVSLLPVAHRHLVVSFKRLALVNQARNGLQNRRTVATQPYRRYQQPWNTRRQTTYWNGLGAEPLVASAPRPLHPRACGPWGSFTTSGSVGFSPVRQLLWRLVRTVVTHPRSRPQFLATRPPTAYHPRSCLPHHTMGGARWRSSWGRWSSDQRAYTWTRCPDVFGSLGRYAHIFARSFSSARPFFSLSRASSYAQTSQTLPVNVSSAFDCKLGLWGQMVTTCDKHCDRSQRRVLSTLRAGNALRNPLRLPVAISTLVGGYTHTLLLQLGTTRQRLARYAHTASGIIQARHAHTFEQDPETVSIASLSGSFGPEHIRFTLAIVSPQLTPLFDTSPTAKASLQTASGLMTKLHTAQEIQQGHLLQLERIVEQVTQSVPCSVSSSASHIILDFPVGMPRYQVTQLLRTLGIDLERPDIGLETMALQTASARVPLPTASTTASDPSMRAHSPLPMPAYPHLDLAQSVCSSTDFTTSSDEALMLEHSVPTLLMDELRTPSPPNTDDAFYTFLTELDALAQDNYVFGQRKQPFRHLSLTG